jgi:hypothetical protein
MTTKPNNAENLDLISWGTDLIPTERNISQIGLFSSTDESVKRALVRRITQVTTTPEGESLQVEIEFSSQSGLPNANDLDKWMAFLKICKLQKDRVGVLSNPISFTAYQMIKLLDLADSGTNYAEISAWCQRMYDVGIASKQVIWIASSEKYADKKVRVFEGIERVRDSSDRRSEKYVVVLAGWLLANLRAEFVLYEDLNTYKRLNKPTARGIFLPLHRWFERNGGHTVERNYHELCQFLGITEQKQRSRIVRTLGKGLDELANVQLLARWDVQTNASGGHKVIFWPGEGMKRALAAQPRLLQSTQKPPELLRPAAVPGGLSSMEEQEALVALLSIGVTPPRKAESIVKHNDPLYILDLVEYARWTKAQDKSGKILNISGLLLWWIKEDMPIPPDFVTSRKRRLAEKQRLQREIEEQQLYELDVAYEQWKTAEIDKEVARQYPGDTLDAGLSRIIDDKIKKDKAFRQIPESQHRNIALQLLKREVREAIALPSLGEWKSRHVQRSLFEK